MIIIARLARSLIKEGVSLRKISGNCRGAFQGSRAGMGMRPTVPDRRPIIGKHPEYSRVAVFNGLGTKGVSLAPYFASILIQLLENGAPVNNEADVNRYKSVYWKVRNQV